MGRRDGIERPHPGEGHCNWCGTAFPTGTAKSRRWCSDACSSKWGIRISESVARWHVGQRDHGVCATCGVDTLWRKAVAERLAGWKQSRTWYTRQWPFALKVRLGEKWGIPYGRIETDWWDMDHIVPLVEGGSRDLENLRTLCIPCHANETRALAARRADSRKAQLPLTSAGGPPK